MHTESSLKCLALKIEGGNLRRATEMCFDGVIHQTPYRAL